MDPGWEELGALDFALLEGGEGEDITLEAHTDFTIVLSIGLPAESM